MAASKTQQAQVAERRRQALDLRRSGMRLQQIADQLGYKTVAHVSQDITRALESTMSELAQTAGELRAVEVERLDALLAAIWSTATDPDDDMPVSDLTKAIETALRITDRRMKLLGLEAPAQVTVSGNPDGTPVLVAQVAGDETARRRALAERLAEILPGSQLPDGVQIDPADLEDGDS